MIGIFALNTVIKSKEEDTMKNENTDNNKVSEIVNIALKGIALASLSIAQFAKKE